MVGLHLGLIFTQVPKFFFLKMSIQVVLGMNSGVSVPCVVGLPWEEAVGYQRHSWLWAALRQTALCVPERQLPW